MTDPTKDDNDDEAPKAVGTEEMTRQNDVQTTIGERGGPQVSGVSPDLSQKDPQDVTVDDLQGLDDDELNEVMAVMNSDDETPATPAEPARATQDTPGETDTSAPTETPTDDTDESGDERDLATLDETGLIDDDDNFQWESEAISETEVGEAGVINKFRYKKTNFEVNEPADRQRFERSFDALAEAQETEDRAKLQATSDRYLKEISKQCLTVDGHDLVDVYRVEHDGTHYVVPDADGSKRLDSHDSAQTLWDAMSWFDRFKVGMIIGQDVLGEGQFRTRID